LRALRKLDRPVVERIKAATESLREDPRPAGAKMLTGMHGVLRIRVAGDYRVLYTVDDDRLVVLVVDAGCHNHYIANCLDGPGGEGDGLAG
jgi:mRNA interferase RelE/StbE